MSVEDFWAKGGGGGSTKVPNQTLWSYPQARCPHPHQNQTSDTPGLILPCGHLRLHDKSIPSLASSPLISLFSLSDTIFFHRLEGKRPNATSRKPCVFRDRSRNRVQYDKTVVKIKRIGVKRRWDEIHW